MITNPEAIKITDEQVMSFVDIVANMTKEEEKRKAFNEDIDYRAQNLLAQGLCDIKSANLTYDDIKEDVRKYAWNLNNVWCILAITDAHIIKVINRVLIERTKPFKTEYITCNKERM